MRGRAGGRDLSARDSCLGVKLGATLLTACSVAIFQNIVLCVWVIIFIVGINSITGGKECKCGQ